MYSLNDPAVRPVAGALVIFSRSIVLRVAIFSDDMSYQVLYGLLPPQYLGTELRRRVEV